MSEGGGKLARFDAHVALRPDVNPWQGDGAFKSDDTLLTTLLDVAVGTSQRSGVVAAAVDVWVAEELRRAGFDPDEVWPRRTSPRVLPRDVRHFVENGLTADLRRQVEARYDTPGARRALPSEAHVMGRAYSKQSDVVIASWAAGVEVLVSTKTMLSSYQKNLRNRFEEGYGDAKNLRGRHPLAALGFMFIAGADIPSSSLDFAIDMLRKLTSEADVYDCACLLIVEGARGSEEGEHVDDRAVNDEPAALVAVPASADVDWAVVSEGDLDDDLDLCGTQPGSSSDVALIPDVVPGDLGPNAFFRTLISAALERMPVAVYPGVRSRLREASTAQSLK